MGRAFGLVSMVCSLALVAILWASSMQHSGPTSERAKHAREDATVAVGSINFTAAAPELEAYRAENGTYAGASLPPAFGVMLIRADATSYCLQSAIGTSVQHFAGPSGATAAGPC